MTSFHLKVFALFFMIIDHIGFIIFPQNLIFRIIGRLAFPLFAYQMTVGFSHTRNKEKHILKLLVFAIICQIPTLMISNLYNVGLSSNIIFTFVISLLIIYSIEKILQQEAYSKFKKFIICSIPTVILIALGVFLKVDYSWYGILLTVTFYFTLNNKALSLLSFFTLVNMNFIINQDIMSLLAYFSLFCCIFILLFNGKQGYKVSWSFYALYFLHFFPIIIVDQYLLHT